MQVFGQLFLANSETLTHSIKNVNAMHFIGKKFVFLADFL